uniref:Uncharacterized protein n=1 Tax=Chromera velia CCMP2878 TaxID=1169474 RepID=A0A0G4HSY7_9ALVE|eukprot:Cvel_31203.t1-p1 / transcript=Cvel_31203.t1 / gene=Cvel_31203 / organism=Chromera_velia_CCMP2878 / gene_product=hypothetical protein / transcript_product=hypothetical protein / location=Cvel_scaffold4607:7869-8138(+) / protein_length=90 / sequence_SO=supercontig / SO=protein_coding / is_pseudo=false
METRMETVRIPHLFFQATSVTPDCHLANQTCLPLLTSPGPPDWRKDAEMGRRLMLARGNPEAAGGTGKIWFGTSRWFACVGVTGVRCRTA